MTAATMAALCGCGMTTNDNPFLTDYNTPFNIPPFESIKYEHYMPALEQGIEMHNQEIAAIVGNEEVPTWENTILALDNSGQLLTNVMKVIFALGSSDNTPEMIAISEKALPMYAAHQGEIGMNADLFARIRAVYDKKETLGLDEAQTRLLEKTYKGFVRSGALLSAEQQDTLKSINTQLTTACLKFSNTLLAATKAARVKDETTGREYTVDAAVRLDVLTNSDNRELRRRMYETYINLATDAEHNNSDNIDTILRLRQRKARLLGFANYAAYQCDNVMSKTPEAAYDLMLQIFNASVAKVKEDVCDMERLLKDDMRKQQTDENSGVVENDKVWRLEPWDYYYYAEKVKAERYNLTENDTKPYFELNNCVQKGIFSLAKRLYGIEITEVKDAPKYNPEVQVYELKDEQGEHVAIFMFDPYARDTKGQGAWMSEFRGACNQSGVVERPIVYNVLNLKKPAEGEPCLLTLDEVQTLFHEFGHALQGMLTRAQYRGQAGTNVDRDAVELPSQINEKWATEPELLSEYALHYQTGEPMPTELVEKLLAAGTHNQGFITCELAGAALLDLEWHTAEIGEEKIDAVAFEKQVAEKLGLPREIQFRYRSPYFKHIFGDDEYAAGYYTYLWADVLVSDGYDLFRENGPFDRATADSYRENILEPGDSRDAMESFVRFRGHRPSPAALLRDRGL